MITINITHLKTAWLQYQIFRLMNYYQPWKIRFVNITAPSVSISPANWWLLPAKHLSNLFYKTQWLGVDYISTKLNLYPSIISEHNIAQHIPENSKNCKKMKIYWNKILKIAKKFFFLKIPKLKISWKCQNFDYF